MRAVVRGLVVAAVAVVLAAAAVLVPATAASADVTYVPSPSNGQKVYLSVACHNAAGSTTCRTNTGCSGFDENFRSRLTAGYAATVTGPSLFDRQYPVRIGTGTREQNISNSNAWGARMHIPIHSNSAGASTCVSGASASVRGTQLLYVSTNGKDLSTELLYTTRDASPGTGDKLVLRSDLAELNSTTAVAGYLEAEFHDWQSGVNWLNDSGNWAWRIGYGVDRCRGYPRSGQGTTSTKYCAW